MTGTKGIERNTAVVIVFSIITFGIYALYWTYKSFQELKDYSGEGIGGVVGLIVGILLYVVDMFLLPAEIEQIYAAKSSSSPVTALTGLWFLLPFVGWIVWVVKVQGAMNSLWAS